MNTLVHGVGINDSNYVQHKYETVDGRKVCVWRCKFYDCWAKMLMRCYSPEYQKLKPSYIGCTVCNEWLTFSNFKSWMEKQDFEGKELDKDIIVSGNKVYSPDTCCFVAKSLNLFLTNTNQENKGLPAGVRKPKGRNEYHAYCRDPFFNGGIFVGSFRSLEDAHNAYLARKHEIACKIADEQTDQRVATALRSRFLNDAERIRQDVK